MVQTPTIRVLCVDDNDLVARSLSRRVGQEPGLEWLGVVTETDDIVQRVTEMAPDVVLMDIDMPGVDTFAIVEELASTHPTARVVMFSGHIDANYIQRALDSSAWGYLSKHDDVNNLISGIKLVGGGEIVFSRDVEAVRDRLLDQLRPQPIAEDHAPPKVPSPPTQPAASKQIKVMVVDDEARLCTAWGRILRAHADLALVSTLHSADELESHVAQHQPDVVLLDLSMPGTPPIDAMRRAIERFPATRFLIYSGHHDRDTAQRVADAGAYGLVDKLESPDVIIAGMRTIASGGRVFGFQIKPRG
jgi:DNA-binding NarL/FixJ family response regulator